LAADKLERRGFAEEIAQLLRNVGPNASFALSIEGPWGSGKTQVLHMIEALLRDEPQSTRPVLVHFNPWLVGDKDALLRQFFTQMAAALELTKHVSNAKSAAKQLISYSKVFDLVKWVPGAEPWASIMKGVLEATGTGVQAAAEQKSPGLEEQKTGVERALRKFGRRIIVFIDDVDRLYPQEVFEMIRIIKSVGDLPHIGYIVAWDHAYVCEALRNASVPYPESYLDKVIQQRVNMPTLSSAGREKLIEEQLKLVDPDAFKPYFSHGDRRYAALYVHDVFELLEHPRDVVRAFNVLRVLEKRVRGNVVFADLVAFSILQIKAASVCRLIRKNKRWFVGKSFNDLTGDDAGAGKEKEISLDSALADCSMPWLVRRVIGYLFPLVFDEKLSAKNNSDYGHIGAPGRLDIVLNQGAGSRDVDYLKIRSYVLDFKNRPIIEASITASIAYEFLAEVAEFVDQALQVELAGVLHGLCVSLAEFADSTEFVIRARKNEISSGPHVAFGVLDKISRKIKPEKIAGLAKQIASSSKSISVASVLIDASYLDPDGSDALRCAPEDKEFILDCFSTNVMDMARVGKLAQLSGFRIVLHVMSEQMPDICPELFDLIKNNRIMLDAFVLSLADYGVDSINGQRYSLSRNLDVVQCFCSLESLRDLAAKRLSDSTMLPRCRAAWQAVADGKIYYGRDGTEAKR